MILTKENLYHPFKGSVLGILSKETVSSENSTGHGLEDINLYHQPLVNPIIAALFTCIMISLLILAEYLQIKILKMLKKDDSILKDIIYLFAIAQIIYCPLLVFLITSTNFVYPLNKVIGQWFCNISQFVLYFLVNIISFHSLVNALMRYLFIVHTKKVELYGKEKLKKVFLLLSILIPLIVTLGKVNNGSTLDALSFINKCNAKDHDVFLFETSTLNVLKKGFCVVGDYNEIDVYSQGIAMLKQLSCIASSVLMFIMGSNLTEVIIYYRLFSYTNR